MFRGKEVEAKDVLSNPARVRILEVVAAKGGASFTELKGLTNLSTGSIYYHLSAMRGYIEQDASRRYVLTTKGLSLVNAIAEGLPPPSPKKEAPGFLRALDFTALGPILRSACDGFHLPVATTFLTLTIGAAIHEAAGTNQVLLATPTHKLIQPAASVLITGWLPLYLLALVAALLATGELRAGALGLAAVAAVSLMPAHLYALLTLVSRPLARAALIPLQLWATLILTVAMNSVRGLRIQYSAVFSLASLYISTGLWLTVL